MAAVVLALSSCSAKNSSDEDALPSVDSDTSEAVPGTEEATASSIDPETLEVTATIDIGGPSSAVAISEDAVWILGFVGTTNRGRVVRIDPETNEVIATVPVGNRSRGIAVSQDAVWVANSEDSTVSRVDPETNEVTATVPVGDTPSGIAVSQDAVWVVNSGDATATRIDPDTNRPVESIVIDASSLYPSDSLEDKLIVFENDLWIVTLGGVVTRSPGSSATIAIPTETAVASLTTSDDAVWFLSDAAMGVNSLGQEVLITGKNSVSRIDPETNQISDRIEFEGAFASGIAVSEDTVWVASLDGPVVRIGSPDLDAGRDPGAANTTLPTAGIDTPTGYNAEVEDNFLETCTAAREVCQCAYNAFEREIPFDRFQQVDDQLSDNPGATVPDDFLDLYTDCANQAVGG